AAHAGLHHHRQRPGFRVFRCDFQIAADMVLSQLLDVGRALDREVVAQARGDMHALHAGDRTRLAIEIDQRTVIGAEIFADVGEDAGRPPTYRLDLLVLAGEPIHVRRRSAEIRDGPGEARHLVADLLDLAQDRVLRAALDDASLMLGDRAEGAAAETAAHDV